MNCYQLADDFSPLYFVKSLIIIITLDATAIVRGFVNLLHS